jgi:hypothetical protein
MRTPSEREALSVNLPARHAGPTDVGCGDVHHPGWTADVDVAFCEIGYELAEMLRTE